MAGWIGVVGVGALILLALSRLEGGERKRDADAGAVTPATGDGEADARRVGELSEVASSSSNSNAAPAADRRPPDSALLSGLRVEDVGGAAVVGATVSLHPLTNDVMGWYWTPSDAEVLSHVAERTNAILDARVVGVTDERGGVQLQAGDVLAAPEGWVLWVSHPAYAPTSVLNSSSQGDLPPLVTLVDGTGGEARVIDAEGEPGNGVDVWVQALLPLEPGAPDDPERLVRRALVRSERTDAAGSVALPDMGGPSLVWAAANGLLSRPAVREGSESVELTLVDCIEVSGRVRSADGAKIGPWATVLLSAIDDTDREVRLGAVPCGSSGFEGCSIPRIPGCESYVARLMFAEVEACTRSFAPPTRGSSVELDFELRTGIVHWFQVREWNQPETLLPGLEVTLSWQRQGKPPSTLIGRTAEGGFVQMIGVPLDVQCVLGVVGDGFADFRSEAMIFAAEDNEQATLVDVERAGELQVRVTRAGEPVNGCSFCIWDDARATDPLFRSDVEGRDGWHVLEKVPAYRGRIAVVAGPTLISEPAALEFADVTEELRMEIECAELVPVRGRVVEAGSGEAVVDAEVWLGSFSDSGKTVAAALEPLRVDGEGRFEGMYPAVERAALSAYSRGPAPATVSVQSGRGVGGSFDFGDVPVERGQALAVALRSLDGATDWDGYRIVGGLHQASGMSGRVDQDGRCILNVGPRFFGMTVHAPGGVATGALFPAQVLPETVVELELYTTATLWLDFVDEAGDPVTVTGSVQMRYSTGQLQMTTIAGVLEQGSRVPVPRPASGRVLLQWRDPEDPQRSVATELSLDGTGDIERTVVVRSAPMAARVVDPAGNPLAGIVVNVGSRSPSGALDSVAVTDADGRAELSYWPSDPEVWLMGGGGTAAPLPVGIDMPRPGQDVDWTYDPRHSLRLRCVDSGAAVAYAGALLRVGSGGAVHDRRVADGQGLIEFGPLGSGSYVVEVRAGPRFPMRVRASVPGMPLDVELRQTGGLEVFVRSSAGQPVTGVELTITCEDLGEGVALWRADGRAPGAGPPATDADGRYAVAGIPWGRYAVRCGDTEEFLDVRPGEQSLLDVTLQ